MRTMALVLIGAFLAMGAAEPPSCRDDQGQERCALEAQAKQRALYKVDSAEQIVARKVTLMRAFFVDVYGRDIGMVSAIYAPGSEPRIEVRSVRGAADPAMTATLGAQAWQRLMGETRYFDRRFAPQPEAAGEVNICLHGWLATVEVVGSSGRVRRTTHNACDEGLALGFAFKLAEAAVAALPACAALDRDTSRNVVTRLADCGMLTGDRLAAAQAFNRWRAGGLGWPDAGQDAALWQYFASDAAIAWPGEPAPATGQRDAAAIWARRGSTDRIYVSSVFGEDADHAWMDAVVAVRAGEETRSVPVRLRWRRVNSSFVLTDLRPAGKPGTTAK